MNFNGIGLIPWINGLETLEKSTNIVEKITEEI